MSGWIFWFSTGFLIGSNFFKTINVYILVKCGHTKQEPRRRPQDPSLCRKIIKKLSKASQFLIILKISLFHMLFINSCLVNWDYTGWVSYFWLLTLIRPKKIARHFITLPSGTVVRRQDPPGHQWSFFRLQIQT